ncbi:TSUP family transporter [Vibrio sp. ZSDE26]|uniref:Probable membrane transporter protein n=1 Tax=Vibrio amylolyticus TaxID=2847292 RepID=A0A9X1XRD8_9VIBR|nr:TSUP family transporter [Vibrio amylolyticus]MCK6264204.1 TSUP family transporter [Vibrio amylolyticus]
MDITFDVLALLFFVAGLAGFIDAMAGGGGLLTLPALLSAGVPPTQALATNKLQSSFGSFSASWYFVRSGIVNLKEMRLAILCTFVGSAIGAELVQHIDAGVLTSLIPILLLGISLYFLMAPQAGEGGGKPKLSESMFAFSVGTGVGFYDGFFGPGTGSIFTICFVAIAQLSIVHATARTKVLNFTSNLAALLFFIIAGLPIWEIGLVMAVGGFIGARMGAKMVVTKGKKYIRPLVVVMSMVMALKLLWAQNAQWLLSLF